ncbi:unnamed protein product, partial [Ilex paraguariensis]
MVNIDNAANPNITTVDAEVGNAKVNGMEDMENARNMAVMEQTFSADKSPDIGASVADKLITDPVPHEMINVCNIANAVLIHDVVGVEVGSLDISPMVVNCGNQEGDGTDNVGISLESPILPDHEDSLILVESDSQILVQMVKGLAIIPWKLQDLLKRIKLLFGMMNLQISHIYREANGLADFLASFAVHSKTYTEFSGSNVLPVAGRLILQQDQTGLPNARLKRILYWLPSVGNCEEFQLLEDEVWQPVGDLDWNCIFPVQELGIFAVPNADLEEDVYQKKKTYTEFSANNILPSIGRLILQQDLYGFPSARLKSLICDQREESRAVLQFLLDAPFPICLDYLLDFFCELLSVDDQIIKGLRLIIWDRLLVFPVSSWTVSEAVFCGLR